MIRNLPTRLLITVLCLFALLAIFLISSKDKISGSIMETKINLVDKSKQITADEFANKRKNYSYVSFDNLYSNTSLYYGTKIHQKGHIKDLDMEHKYLLIALDGNDESKTIKLKYNLSNFERGNVSLQENDPIKFYGRVLTTDNYINDKGRTVQRPVISADFIQSRI
ncbi:hypothetical protein [Companilactobacillus futsaii]|uniref:Uncharacterized protein n=1 Tax=Companilactobacillus futsaii TaxID=938155 RepID=A0A5B7SYJ3_9LACO|nr:hypothetical protein [Companilactobacillus futsaii]QCX24867.1 hypothetical protein FG051_06970 [Companilactobacillus futsaii]